MNINDEMNKISEKLKNIQNMPFKDNRTYDKVGFIYDLKLLVNQLEYFFDKLVPQQNNNPSKTFYEPDQSPKEHQIAYFNLLHGFPKELYGGHYCYVLKQFKNKYIVIPTTSVKNSSAKLNPEFEIDIKIKDFINNSTTRLQVSDIRCIDVQRIYLKKGIFDVETDRNYIIKRLQRIIFNNVDKI